MFTKKKVYVIGTAVLLFFISFGMGYLFMESMIKNQNHLISQQEDIDQNNIEDIQIVKEENRITPNTFIEERIHYKECGHLVSNVYLAKENYVNMTKEEFSEYIYNNSPELSVISFSNVKIVLWGEKHHLCKDHYIIGVENGKIAIYNIDDQGERVLEKIFEDYPIDLLREVDQERLLEGIVIDSKEELSDILENYIS